MDILDEAVSGLGLTDKQLNEMERAETDEVLQAEVVQELDRILRYYSVGSF
jgi:hypothetical protein